MSIVGLITDQSVAQELPHLCADGVDLVKRVAANQMAQNQSSSFDPKESRSS